MSTQPTLWDAPRTGGVRRTDPLTSHRAAQSINPDLLEGMVLKALEGGPANCDELCERLRMEWNTVSPRLAPLRRNGFIEACGSKLGAKGRNQRLWKLTEKGQRVIG